MVYGFSSRLWLRGFVAGLLISGAFISLPAGAVPSEQQKDRLRAAALQAQKAEQAGPRDVTLNDQATLHVPAGEMFIPAQQADDLMAAMGNGHLPGRVGMIVPQHGKAGWIVDVTWVHDGYVRDGDAKEWQPDTMLDGLREGTEKQNSERVAQGMPALDIIGWVEKPTYDNATHRLIWSVAARERGAPADQPQTINYNTYALGREGYFSLDLITDSQGINAHKAVARNLLAALQYTPGKNYEAFNSSTDKVAAYGLAGLIGVVVVKKLGLLAVIGLFLLKIWKVALVMMLGGWAAVRRFFGNLFKRKS